MSNGMHPFGEGVKRQLNILSYEFDLKLFNDPNVLDSNGVLAQELIADMIRKEPIKRPSAKAILSHPFFWNAEKILNFLQVGICILTQSMLHVHHYRRTDLFLSTNHELNLFLIFRM